jgi:pyrroloquinoline quinone biosynthesis protein D
MRTDLTASATISPKSQPKLQTFVRLQYDEARQRWVLQAPERVLVLDETSKEIIDLCTGEASVGQIVDRLAADYEDARDMIEHDVLAVLRLLADKNLLAFEQASGAE